MRKVRIKGLPNKTQGGPTGGAADGLRRFLEGKKTHDQGMNQFSAPEFEVNNTMSGVPSEHANIEAEGGEVAMVPGMGGIPEAYTITGDRHNNGGVPLSLSEDSFIFSDHKKGKKGESGMKIKDPEILAEFGVSVGKNKPKGKTPADLANKYKINDYKKILLDPDSDRLAQETAEIMIQNYNQKLSKLALVQESMKGFPQGIPAIAMPYLQQIQATGEEFLPQQPQEQMPQQNPMQQLMAAYGLGVSGDPSQYSYRDGGIYIKPSKKGTFTAAATKHGMGVQEFASRVLANKEDYSPAMVKKANFAKNAAGWKKGQVGGAVGNGDMMNRFPGLTIAQDGFSMGSTEFTGAFWDSILQDGGKVTRYNSFMGPDGQRYTIKNGVYIKVNDQGQPIEGTSAPAGGEEKGPVETNKTEKPKTEIPGKYKTDAYKMGTDAYKENIKNLKPGDYILGTDGKWQKVTYVPPVVEYKGEDYETVWGTGEGAETYANQYAFLEQSFQDPDIRDQFVKDTKAALRNENYYKRKDGSMGERYTDEEIDAMTPDYLINQHLAMQKRNYALQAQGIDPNDFTDRNGAMDPNLDSEKKAYYESLGITDLNSAYAVTGNPITDEDVAAGNIGVQQATYWGYRDMLKNKENYSPELQDKLKYFQGPESQLAVGATDEGQTGETQISPIDSKSRNFYTDTSAGELDWVDLGDITTEVIDTPEEPTPEIPVEDPEFVRHVPRDEWWAQDIGNIGNLFGQRMGLKKYLPHSQPVDLARPDVLYFDPSRALAANAEQANIAAQAAASFAGPQGTYRMSGIAGDAFRNAMGVLGDYENKNVAIGNQYLDKVTQVANQENLANAERLQRLFDQTTIANQQFDNSKRAANRNLFEAWRQGLTNKKMTQAMNALYPQFETIPSIGGGLYYTGVRRPFTNTGTTGTDSNTAYLDELNKLKTQYPDVEEASIRKQLDQKYGRTTGPLMDPYADAKNFYSGISGLNPGMIPKGAYPPGMYPV